MKRSVTVQIAGQKYQLRSDEDEKVVTRLAASVDRRIKQIQKAGKGFDTQRVAVLAALQLAEELNAQEEALAELKRQVRDRSRTLLKLLDRQVHL